MYAGVGGQQQQYGNPNDFHQMSGQQQLYGAGYQDPNIAMGAGVGMGQFGAPQQ